MKNEARELYYQGAVTEDPLVYLPIEDKISGWKPKIKSDVLEALEEPLFLMDESLRFLFSLSEHYASMDRIENIGFLEIQLAKIRSDILSIRELLLLGQASTAQSIARLFIEDLEVAMAMLIDSEFIEAFSDPDIKNFWSKYIGYGNIKIQVRNFLLKARNNDEQIEYQIQRHKELKNYLSSRVHASFHSSLSTAFPEILDSPGYFTAFPMGSVDKNMAPMCMAISELVHVFSASYINILVGDDPPPLIAMDHKGSTFNTLIASANVLQSLTVKHSDRIYSEHQTLVDASESQ